MRNKLDRPMNSVLIPGGAGFIGSHLAAEFLEKGYRVTVIDGLLEKTGGRIKNLKPIFDQIAFIPEKVENFKDLPELIKKNDLIVDCMAWTSHILAMDDPGYDLQLNTQSHLRLLTAVIHSKCKGKRIIYLGSRGQYGSPNTKRITEKSCMEPNDIQGIHKQAAESYFRVFAARHGLNVVSLRIPNCFGENQMTAGSDIGLMGGIIRDLIKGNEIKVFGRDRKRDIIYVKDLCRIIGKIASLNFQGFNAYNVRGIEVPILDLVKMLMRITGSGSCRVMEIPADIRALDPAPAIYSASKLTKLIGKAEFRTMETTLKRTIEFFKEETS